MSLTSEMDRKDSPVRRFLRETFPNTRGPLAACREALRAPLVADLPADSHPGAYSQIGTATDYRIRYHFAITPVREFVAWPGAVLVVRSDEVDLPPAGLARAQLIREDSKLTRACVAGFFGALDRAASAIAPHRHRPDEAEERTLARFCLVLAAFEAAFRNPYAWPPPYLGAARPGSASELLALVPDDWVEDAAALGAAFAERYPAWRGTGAVLNPNFAGSLDIGGADADLIADGCLWEIKTTKGRGAQGEWLRQLLGYVLLDYEDEHAIERVGLLLPRQNTRFSWSVRELIGELSGRDDLGLPILRDRFRRICEALRDGGDGGQGAR